MGIKPSISAVSGSGVRDRVVAICKICRHGITEDAPRLWSRKPLGLVHTDCAPVGEP